MQIIKHRLEKRVSHRWGKKRIKSDQEKTARFLWTLRTCSANVFYHLGTKAALITSFLPWFPSPRRDSIAQHLRVSRRLAILAWNATLERVFWECWECWEWLLRARPLSFPELRLPGDLSSLSFLGGFHAIVFSSIIVESPWTRCERNNNAICSTWENALTISLPLIKVSALDCDSAAKTFDSMIQLPTLNLDYQGLVKVYFLVSFFFFIRSNEVTKFCPIRVSAIVIQRFLTHFTIA